MNNIKKAYAISDAKISYVSLVDKAANKRTFLITKNENGTAKFSSFGRILKADADAHYVTGIVYEPMTEDAHGNYMTEEEIIKAAYWFAKNGNQVDLQHCFQPMDGAAVVESYVTKCDMELEGQPIQKGTWMMTVEVTDPDIFSAIQKGEITGFSMGGVGCYSDIDVPVEKAEQTPPEDEKGFFSWLKKQLGIAPAPVAVEKGAVAERYERSMKESGFWTALNAMEDVLYRYNWQTDSWDFEDNETIIAEALSDFVRIASDILTSGQPISKALSPQAVSKAGKALSSKNRETLQAISDNLSSFLANFDEEQEENEDMSITKEDAAIIAKAIAAEMNPAPAAQQPPLPPDAPVEKQEIELDAKNVQKWIQDAVEKALNPEEEPEPVTAENVQKWITDAVEKAVEPVRKAAGVPSNLNNAGEGSSVEKAEEHYLHGLL